MIQHGGHGSPAMAMPSPPEGWALKGSLLCAPVGPPANSKHDPRSKPVRKEKAKDTPRGLLLHGYMPRICLGGCRV